MKVIIDVPDHLYKLLKDFPSDSNETTIENVLMKAVENGTPIPDNATNGDVITEILKSSNDMHSIRYIGLAQEDTIYIEVGSNWWNAPYERSSDAENIHKK